MRLARSALHDAPRERAELIAFCVVEPQDPPPPSEMLTTFAGFALLGTPVTVPPDRLAALRRAVVEANAPAWSPDLDDLATRAAASPEEDVKELEERMKLLGYL